MLIEEAKNEILTKGTTEDQRKMMFCGHLLGKVEDLLKEVSDVEAYPSLKYLAELIAFIPEMRIDAEHMRSASSQ